MDAPSTRQPSAALFQALPKVELHRHLEGSLRLETLVEIASQYGMEGASRGSLGPLVQVGAAEPLTFHNFLSKFETLRRFYRSPEVIQRLTREAIADAAADNVRYLELRFTPAALSKAQSFPLAEIMDWVLAGVEQAASAGGMVTRLIASLNRHEPFELAEQVIHLAVERQARGIVGIDVAGNEASHPDLDRFAGLLAEARQAGLGLTIHCSEWGGAQNTAQAIVHYHADRIGHGVRVMEDADAVALARETGTPFEVCLTSNLHTGAVTGLAEHPFRLMLDAGLNVTLNTDDPSISQITLSQELQLACERLALTMSGLRQRMLAAAQAAFLPPAERAALSLRLAQEFDQVVG